MQKIKDIVSSICIFFLLLNPALAQSTAAILPQGKTQFLDNNGNPLSSGKVYFYIPSTTTFKTTWQDAAETIANANPVVLDAGGRAIIYGAGTYRQRVFNSVNTLIYDAVTASAGSGGGTTGTGDGDLVGTVKPWAGLAAPNQYVFAYGQEISRTTYSAFFTATTLIQNINCISASPILTGLSDTSQIPNGAVLEATCIAAGAKVLSKTSTTVTMNSNASLTTSTNGTFFLYGNGNGSTTFNVPDLRGLTVVGRCNMGGTTCSILTQQYFGGNPSATGSLGGAAAHQIALSELPPYTPLGTVVAAGTVSTPTITVNGVNNTYLINTGGSTWQSGANGGIASITATATSSTPVFANSGSTFTGTPQGGTSTAFSMVQPSRTLNYIVKIIPDSNSADASGVTSIQGMVGDIACGPGLTCTGNIITSSGSDAILPVISGNVPIFSGTTGLIADSSILTVQTNTSELFFGIGNNIADAIARKVATKMPLITSDRLANWNNINDQTFSDWTVVSPINSTSNQYASFASNLSSSTGAFNLNHMVAFEDIMHYKGSGVLTEQWSFLSNATHEGTGAITNRRAINVQEMIGTGPIVNNYGMYVQSLTKGSSTNYGIYTDGTTQNFFGGDVTIGVTIPAASTNRNLHLNGATSGAGGGSSILGNNSNWTVGNASSLLGGAYDATLLFASSTNAYRFFGLTAGVMSTSSNGTVSVISSSTTVNGQVCALGSTCTISASAGTITVGTTSIASGTSTRILYNNGGLLGEYSITGTGTTVVMAAAPTITGHPTIEGVTSTGATGTGNFVFSASPTLSGTVAGNITISGNNTHSGTSLFTGTTPSLANGNGAVAASATKGGIFTGKGSVSDITIQNGAGSDVCTIATGATTINCATLSLTNKLGSSFMTVGTNSVLGVVQCDGTTINCTAGVITAVGAAASSIGVGTTTISAGAASNILYNNAGTLGNATIASFLTGGTGITISGTTNATIGLTNNLGTPNFKATLTSSQSVTSATTTKINFNSILIDTGSYWDSTNKQYKPLISGTYFVAAQFVSTGTFTLGQDVLGYISKNGLKGGGGTALATGSLTCPTAASCSTVGMSTIVAMNGSTDTLEIDAIIAATSPNVLGDADVSTYFLAYRIGP